MKHSHYDTEGRSGQGYMGMRIVMRIVIRSVAGGWQVRARVSGTRPGQPHCTAVCGTLGTRGSALALEGEATLIRGKYGVWGVPIGNYSLLSTHYSLIYGVWGLLSVRRSFSGGGI